MPVCCTCKKEFKTTRALNAHQVSHKDGFRYKHRSEYSNRKLRVTIKCLYCLKEHTVVEGATRKYCDNQCQANYELTEAIHSENYTKCNAISWFRKITEYKCDECGISEWNGKRLTLQVDHIDGNNDNNLLENFRYLCPNCHTQTDTWGSKNIGPIKRRRLLANLESD